MRLLSFLTAVENSVGQTRPELVGQKTTRQVSYGQGLSLLSWPDFAFSLRNYRLPDGRTCVRGNWLDREHRVETTHTYFETPETNWAAAAYEVAMACPYGQETVRQADQDHETRAAFRSAQVA